MKHRRYHSSLRRHYAPIVHNIVRNATLSLPEFLTGTAFIAAIFALPIVTACFYR